MSLRLSSHLQTLSSAVGLSKSSNPKVKDQVADGTTPDILNACDRSGAEDQEGANFLEPVDEEVEEQEASKNKDEERDESAEEHCGFDCSNLIRACRSFKATSADRCGRALPSNCFTSVPSSITDLRGSSGIRSKLCVFDGAPDGGNNLSNLANPSSILRSIRKINTSGAFHNNNHGSPADERSLVDSEAEEKIIETCNEIQKQSKDSNDYRFIKLQNGVRILLVSNPKANTSAASLDIKIGSFYDPVNLQGLCHLCEHVLFTGSERYPNESYSAFLAQRGGSSNAYTSSEHTNFHFDVPSVHFIESLERFVSFFVCPIFRENSVQSELEIVQSEHEKNRYNDVWRTNQVERATSNPNHAFSRFSTGTRQTLEISHSSDRNLRYELFTFYKTNYSGNLISACLIHNKSLDEMEDSAKRIFLAIVNKNIPERIWPMNTFKNNQMRTKIFVVPVKDIYHVNLTFPMEDMCQYYSSAPDGYVAQLIGHKGPGGLFSYLRRHGLAHHVVSSCKTLARGFSFFMITIQLTDRGERGVDDVIKVVFQYVHLLKETGPLQWFYEEIRYLSKCQFEQKEAERVQNYACNIANWLHLYPPKEVLTGDYIFSSWRPDLVDRIYAYLSPDNLRITILSKRSRIFATQVEPHYGTEYHMEKIPSTVLGSWRKCSFNEELKLPQPNDLIDKSLSLVPRDKRESGGLPELFLLLERIRMKAWFLPCTYFKLPKAFVFVKFSSPKLVSRNARNCAINCLFTFLVKDLLTEYSYCGELAGLFYSLKPTKCGIELGVRGYSGKQHLFLQKILSTLYGSRTQFTRDRFEQVHEIHRKGIESSEAEPLKSQVRYLLSYVLNPKTFHRSKRLQELSTIKFHDILAYADDFLLNHSVECFFFGNLTLQQTDELSNIAIECRKNYLERRATQEEVSVDTNPYLEEWFLKNPVERIVSFEDALLKNAEVKKIKAANRKRLPSHTPSLLMNNSPVPQKRSSTLSLKPTRASITNLHSVSAEPHQNGGIDTDSEVTVSEDEVNAETPLSDFTNVEFRIPSSKHQQNLFIVHNEIQSSSCVLFYLQYLENHPKHSALIETFFHLTRERLISHMKNTVQLGYVVNCDIRKGDANLTLGLRIVVESQYPLQIVHTTIEEALAVLEDYLDNQMSDGSFETNKAALIVSKEDFWNNRMHDRATSLWKEVSDETYNFKRAEDEIKFIKDITLDQVRRFYHDWIKIDGEERHHLVISVGPDPILNKLDIALEGSSKDGRKVRHWDIREVEVYRRDAKSFTRLSDKQLSQWQKDVFDSESICYSPPANYQPRNTGTTIKQLSIKDITLDQVRRFYHDWIKIDGEEGHHLVISVGPDPILNKLDIVLEGSSKDGRKVRHWDICEVEVYRRDAKSFTRLNDKQLSQWQKDVFDSESICYSPPANYQPRNTGATIKQVDQGQSYSQGSLQP